MTFAKDDRLVPVYPDHLGIVSSSWLPDSASKLIIIIITIYWDWLTILTKEIVLVNADDTGERWSWSQILHPGFYGEMIQLSLQLAGSHRTPWADLMFTTKMQPLPTWGVATSITRKVKRSPWPRTEQNASSILMYKHWTCEISQANSLDPHSASFAQHREALYACSVSLPP